MLVVLLKETPLHKAYIDALAGDPVSAFGGVLIANTQIDAATANEIHTLFCEVVIAPSFASDAIEILKGKKNRILLIQKQVTLSKTTVRTCLNGTLVQDRNTITDTQEGVTYPTSKKPNLSRDERFTFCIQNLQAYQIKYNCTGKKWSVMCQWNRTNLSCRRPKSSIEKAKNFNFDLQGAVMASDAFFPFPDCVEIAHTAGITAVIQPGGSIKDQLSIDYCDANNVSMVFTATRHFKH